MNNIRFVTEGLFQGFSQRRVRLNEKGPRVPILSREGGEEFSAMRPKVPDRRWSRQKCRKERMLSKTSNAQPIEKAVKYALKHGSHIRAKLISKSGESKRKRFTRRVLQPGGL